MGSDTLEQCIGAWGQRRVVTDYTTEVNVNIGRLYRRGHVPPNRYFVLPLNSNRTALNLTLTMDSCK